MSKLSGWVAILDAQGNVISTRDLGPTPIEVKTQFVKPLDVQKPDIGEGEQHTGPVYAVEADRVVATYGKEPIPPEPPSLESIVAAIEQRVTALEAAKDVVHA